ncbi:MAG: ketoacyl-ACP synthase III [Acidimicrobiales bacterium]|nr:ketoacyl-ACP synthase III [Acidimicrobiales bacterium]
MTSTLTAPAPAGPSTVRPGLPVAVLGLGVDLPAEVVTNDDLAKVLDTSDEWIRTRTGIAQRHVADAADATSDLAARAAQRALDDAGIAAADLGLLLVATTTPDHPIPGTAPLVAARLGVEVAALDVNAACSGFVYGLQLAAGSVLATGAPVLLVGAETLTRVVDPADRTVRVLFGDGAGAVVLGADDRGSLGPFDLGSDGTDPSILWREATGTRLPVADDDAGRTYLTMRGREVYRNAVQRMAASSRAVLEAAGLGLDDVDLFVGHQANKRILDAVVDRLGMPPERCHVTVDRHANTSAASIPLALADARAAGRLHPGSRVLLTAFGAGLTWGSTLLTWTTEEPA